MGTYAILEVMHSCWDCLVQFFYEFFFKNLTVWRKSKYRRTKLCVEDYMKVSIGFRIYKVSDSSYRSASFDSALSLIFG
jgi:hypothetical protein